MDFDMMDFLNSIFRWIHIIAGITWIGLLYFFNWVNSAFGPTMDAETKQKVIPELIPRTLYWFRWGAAFTWVTGVLLLLIVFYHGQVVLDDPTGGLGARVWIMFLATFGAVFVYDNLYSGPLKDPQTGFIAGVVLSGVMVFLYGALGGFSFRGTAIHLGALYGTNMAFNVWFRIWPAQQKIITAIKNGDAPDGDLAALAGSRSKHNTYMSIPLVFLMINQHDTWAAGSPTFWLTIIVLVGWLVCRQLYKKAATVPGF